MSTLIGVDLNGVLDTVAGLDQKPRHAPAPPVVVTDTPQGTLTGMEALLSPFGRPGLAATVGQRTSVLELLGALTSNDSEAPHQVGQHLHSLLSGNGRGGCVIAVPDIPTFNERARDRLLSGASQADVNARLLWRPVAALLGWGAKLSDAKIQALHANRACILQLLPEGIAVSELDVECVEQEGRPTLVPVRRRDGLRKMHVYSKTGLPHLLAAEMGLTDACLLWASSWAWNALLGRDAKPDLFPDAHSPSGWHIVEGFSTLQRELALAISATVDKILSEQRSVLRNASVILIEGPLAGASIKPRLRNATSLCQWLQSKLVDQIAPTNLIVMPTTEGLVARGCAVFAERQSKGHITYYDFLPMLEINVLRGGEHTFAPLIDKNDRVEGGKTYSNTLSDQFFISRKTKLLTFYLLKEDEKNARRSETILSVDNKVKISLHVTQTPAQGHARVEVCPEVHGILGNKPILLDWSTMDEIDWSREEIILKLITDGIGYPNILPQKAHRLIWEKTKILDTIKRFNACSTRDHQYNSIINQQHTGAQDHIGSRASPFILTRGVEQDKHIYTAVDSYGHLPDEVSAEVIEEFNNFREKLGRDFNFVINNFEITNIKTRLEQLARLGATLYTSCPDAIVRYYRRVAKLNGPSSKLIFYAGRIFCSAADLNSLFLYCEKRYKKASAFGTPLSWYVIKAAGDALAFREKAGELLDPSIANSLADAVIYVLKIEVKKRKFKNPFKVAVRLCAFLLRHRMNSKYRDFLHLKSLNESNKQRAKELLELLEEASNFDLNEELKDNIDLIREHILYQGTNSIIDIPPVDDEDHKRQSGDS